MFGFDVLYRLYRDLGECERMAGMLGIEAPAPLDAMLAAWPQP